MSGFLGLGLPPEGKNVIGQVFGRLTAVTYYGKCGSSYAWYCRCSCGGDKVVKLEHLQAGRVKSCGCLRKAKS